MLAEHMQKSEYVSGRLEEIAEVNSAIQAHLRENAAIRDVEMQGLQDALLEKTQHVDSLRSELTTLKESMERSSTDCKKSNQALPPLD